MQLSRIEEMLKISKKYNTERTLEKFLLEEVNIKSISTLEKILMLIKDKEVPEDVRNILIERLEYGSINRTVTTLPKIVPYEEQYPNLPKAPLPIICQVEDTK